MAQKETKTIRISKIQGNFYINAPDLIDWLDSITGSPAHCKARDYIIKRLLEMFYNDNDQADIR